jgi:hypothetical protein
VLRGTRAALPAPSLLLSPGQLEVEFLPVLPAAIDADEHATTALRDRARSEILAALGEPDLTQAAA